MDEVLMQDSAWPLSICPSCKCSYNWSEIEPDDIQEEPDCPGCGAKIQIGLIFRTIVVEPEVLAFDDALRIARGCFDYGGGYRADVDKLEVFHHGIQTVVNALERAHKTGLSELQTQVLHSTGAPQEAAET